MKNMKMIRYMKKYENDKKHEKYENDKIMKK